MTRQEQCGRCKRPAPPSVPGPEGQAQQGWTVFEGDPELVVDIPADGAILPEEVHGAIRDFEGLIRIESDPQVEVAAAREIQSHWLGLVCPDCQAETGWDYAQWSWFFASGEVER